MRLKRSSTGTRRINRLHRRLSATVGVIGQGRLAFVQRFVQRVLLTLFLLSTVALAQEKPDAPKPKHDRKVFIAGTVLLAASSAADAISTKQLLDRGGWESNPILGRHPSNARLTGVFAAEFAMEALAFRLTEHGRKPWLRWLGRAYIGFSIEEHSRLAGCNSRIDVHTPNQNCRPLVPKM